MFPNERHLNKFRTKHISGAVNSLLETIGDKDENVKSAVERSLVRMCKRRPNETIEIICSYRQKCPKLPEPQVAILLRYVYYCIIMYIVLHFFVR